MKKIILILLLLVALPCFANEPDTLKIHFIDIGEGDAILIQSGPDSMLIDTGNILSGYKLVEYLKTNNVKTINRLVVTHPDLDHLCGAFFLLPKFKVENLYDNGTSLPSDPMLNWYGLIFRSREGYRVLKEKDILKFGEASLKVLWPPATGKLVGSFNHNSLVIMLHFKNFRCLFTGDLDKEAEIELVKKKTALKANLLKVGHHGAGDATSLDFLKRVRPDVAIISVNANNPRGYPAESVLGLLKESSITTYRTDKSGSIVITVYAQAKYTVQTER